MTDWSIDKLIRTAQAHDRRARRFRDNESEEHVYFDYRSSRKLAFDARKWARRKVNDD